MAKVKICLTADILISFHILFFFSTSRTVLAIAGEDFSVIASDTRLSQGFAIHTRDSPKTYKL